MTDGRTDRIASTVTRSAHADGQQKVKKNNTHTHNAGHATCEQDRSTLYLINKRRDARVQTHLYWFGLYLPRDANKRYSPRQVRRR